MDAITHFFASFAPKELAFFLAILGLIAAITAVRALPYVRRERRSVTGRLANCVLTRTRLSRSERSDGRSQPVQPAVREVVLLTVDEEKYRIDPDMSAFASAAALRDAVSALVGSTVTLTCWPDQDNLVVDLTSGSKAFVDGERLLNRKRLTLAAFGVIALGLLAAAAVLALR